MTSFLVVFCTYPDSQSANESVETLLDKKIVACGNVIDPIHSFFVWQGKKESKGEVMVIYKTTRSLFEKLEAEVKRLHPYEEPEIIGLPIVCGSESFLNWIDESTI